MSLQRAATLLPLPAWKALQHPTRSENPNGPKKCLRVSGDATRKTACNGESVAAVVTGSGCWNFDVRVVLNHRLNCEISKKISKLQYPLLA
jgi:hypothetical protein